MASIKTEVWAKEIVQELLPDNSIVNQSTNDDMYATASMVHIPVAGASPKVVVDNSNWPLVPQKREDTVTSYGISRLDTRPTVVVGLEELELSYNKRKSVFNAHVAALNNYAANFVIEKWSPTIAAGGAIIRTTGASRSAIVQGATGNRKKITLKDFIKAAEILDNKDVPSDGRVVFLPASMKNDLFSIADIKKKEAFGVQVLQKGVVSEIMGFKVMYRSQAGVYDEAGETPIDMFNATPAILEKTNAAALFFHPLFVRKAFYNAQVNIGQKDPAFSGGRTFNACMRLGAASTYGDYTGVVALVEGK